MKEIKKLYTLVLKKYIIKESIAIFLIMITTFLSMLKPLVTSGIIDQAIANKDYNLLKIYIILFIIVFFVSELLKLVQSAFNIYISQNMTNDMQYYFFNSFTRKNILTINDKTGEIISRTVNEIPKITEFITNTLPVFLMNIFTLVIGMLMMFILNTEITLYCILFLPLIFIINKFFSKKVKFKSEINLKDAAHATDVIEQSLTNIYIIKYLRRYEYIDFMYTKAINKVKRSQYDIFKLNMIMTILLTIITFFPHLIVLILSSTKVIKGNLSLGDMVALSNYIGYIISPILFFSQTTIGWQQVKVIVKRFLEYTTQNENNRINNLIKVQGNEISIINVNFKYHNKDIFQNLNLSVKKGDIIKIYGKNGSGKTTFVNLISNLYSVSSGKILIDSIPIENIDFINMIGISMQKNNLFNDTVRNNITLGRNVSDSEILNYAEKIGFKNFLNNELKLDTIVLSQGNNISGGQAQKINILRAIVGHYPILIFDEYDSFLDAESKKDVEDFINSIQNAIVFVITHHKETAINYTKFLDITKFQ